MRIKHSRKGNSYVAVIEMMTDTPGKLVAVAKGPTLPVAITRVALIAERIADDPVIQAMSPDANPEKLALIRELGQAAQDGPEELYDFLADSHEELGASGRKLAKKVRRHVEVTSARPSGGRHGDPNPDDGGGEQYDDNGVPYDPASLGDVEDVSGFWDDVKNVASQAGSEAWKQVKAHRKELAMAAAGAAFGPAGVPIAAKAMDLVAAAQAGHPEAKEAIANVKAKADAGDKKSRLMFGFIKKEVKATKDDAKNAPEPAAPEHAPVERDHGDGADMVDHDNGGAQ
jgi:hypothetical protein